MSDIMITKDPERVANELSFPAACWFFDKNGIFDMATDLEDETVKKITKRINGGYHGLEDRIKKTRLYATYIG